MPRPSAMPPGAAWPTVVIRSRSGLWGTRALAALAIVLFGWELVQGGAAAGARALPWLGLVLLVAWLLWGCARIVLGDELLIDNPLSRIRIGWRSVQSASGRWGVSVVAAGRTHRAWAAPARGGVVGALTSTPDRVDLPEHPGTGAAPRELDLPARSAAVLIGEQILVRAPTGSTTVERTIHWPRVAGLVLLGVLCGLTLG